MPEVASFLELAGEFRCIWFSIHSEEGLQLDYFYTSGAPVETDARVRGPLSEEQICGIARNESRQMSWENAVEAMSEVRAAATGHFYGRFLFGPNYKPVIFSSLTTADNRPGSQERPWLWSSS